MSDIVGILWEHQKNGVPISREAVENAFRVLYGVDTSIPEISRILLDAVYAECNYEALYQSTNENEVESKALLLEFEQKYPNTLKGENIDTILEQARKRRKKDDRER